MVVLREYLTDFRICIERAGANKASADLFVPVIGSRSLNSLEYQMAAMVYFMQIVEGVC